MMLWRMFVFADSERIWVNPLAHDNLTKNAKKKSHHPWPWLVNKESWLCFCKTSRHPSCVVPGWVCKNSRLRQTKMLIFNKHITASLLQIAVSFSVAYCLPFRHDCAPFHDYYLDPLQQNRFVGTNVKLKSQNNLKKQV